MEPGVIGFRVLAISVRALSCNVQGPFAVNLLASQSVYVSSQSSPTIQSGAPVQNLNQGLPLHLQGLGNDLANRFPGGLGQNVFNAGQGVASNPLAYSQALNNNLAARRFNQASSAPLPDPPLKDNAM